MEIQRLNETIVLHKQELTQKMTDLENEKKKQLTIDWQHREISHVQNLNKQL